jgi:hypothetical protein
MALTKLLWIEEVVGLLHLHMTGPLAALGSPGA